LLGQHDQRGHRFIGHVNLHGVVKCHSMATQENNVNTIACLS
jgi:hypothetical protein